MRTIHSLVFRSTLLMSFLIVVACLALTHGATLANTDQTKDTPTAITEKPAPQGCELNDRYPESILQWCDLIVENADTHNLPPNLLAALIWLESGGNPSAYSTSGAVGLMQVMPRDGLAASFTCINGPCFASRPTIAELQDPQYNIEYGTRMLAGLFARYQDMREALKSYGPHDAGYTYADKVLGIYERYRGE